MEEVNPRDRILHYFMNMEGPRKTCEDAEKHSSHCLGCVEREAPTDREEGLIFEGFPQITS